jgi:hypothetical protein
LLETRPAQRLVEDQREAVEPMRVVGLGEVKIAPNRYRLVGQEGRVDLAVDGGPDRGRLTEVMTEAGARSPLFKVW